MLLKNEFSKILKRYDAYNKNELIEYKNYLLSNFKFNDESIFLSWEFLRLVVKNDEICKWYDNYKCNDNHITTLAKALYKTLDL